MVGGFHGVLLLPAKRSKTSCRTGKLLVNGVLENHSVGQQYPLELIVEHHPISAKDQVRLHQFSKKVLLGVFLGHAL